MICYFCLELTSTLIMSKTPDEAIRDIFEEFENREKKKIESHKINDLWIPTVEEWLDILTACKESNYFAVVRLLYDNNNYPQSSDDISYALQNSPLVKKGGAHINNAQTSINRYLRNSGSNIILRRALKKYEDESGTRKFYFSKGNFKP